MSTSISALVIASSGSGSERFKRYLTRDEVGTNHAIPVKSMSQVNSY